MNVVVVYGCACSGKSTYARSQMGSRDIVYDYDRIVQAITNKNTHDTEKHAAHDIALRLRWNLLHNAQSDPNIETVFILSRWPSEGIRAALKGYDVRYHLVDATEAECLERLESDESRPDKEAWASVIHEWFEEHAEDMQKKEARGMKELRVCEIRAENPAGVEALIITGRPVVYDQPTTVNDPAGSYTEIIRRGALEGADISDARLLYNHDLKRIPLARTPRTMQLIHDPAGLRMEAHLPDTEDGRGVYTAVKRGDLNGMSFAFKVPKGGDRYNPATNTREILRIEKVYEVSVVPFPAYPQASVEARAAMSEAEASRAALKIKINQILKRSDNP